MLVLEWKERAFIEILNSRCFCRFPAAIYIGTPNGAPTWRLHTKLYKGAWNLSANNSETAGHKDLRLWQIVYILAFYNISFSWLFSTGRFQFIFLLSDSENDLYWVGSDKFVAVYSRLPITRTLANSNLALTRTKIDFPWISFIHSL